MTGIAVELMPDDGAPQVGVTVDGLDVGTSVITVEVTWDGGTSWHPVRGLSSLTVVGGSTFVRDHVPPLNVEATYRLTVVSGTSPATLEASITVTSDTAWVQDPLVPRSAVPVLSVGTEAVSLLSGSFESLTRAQVSDVVRVEGARYPVASVGRRQAPSNIPLHLRALVAEQAALVASLRDLFDQSGTLVIRGLPSSVPLDAVAHVIAGDVVEVPAPGRLLGVRNDWLLEVTQVRPTSMSIVVPWWTYDQVAALWTGDTYDDALAARPGDTYLDWLRSPEVP